MTATMSTRTEHFYPSVDSLGRATSRYRTGPRPGAPCGRKITFSVHGVRGTGPARRVLLRPLGEVVHTVNGMRFEPAHEPGDYVLAFWVTASRFDVHLFDRTGDEV